MEYFGKYHSTIVKDIIREFPIIYLLGLHWLFKCNYKGQSSLIMLIMLSI